MLAETDVLEKSGRVTQRKRGALMPYPPRKGGQQRQRGKTTECDQVLSLKKKKGEDVDSYLTRNCENS